MTSPREDRPRARQQPAAGEVARPGEDGNECHELERIGGAGVGQDFPEQPQHRLRDADRPDRPVEEAAFVPLSLGRWLDPRQAAERAQHPDRHDDRKVGGVVHLPHHPRARDDGVGEAGGVQHRKGDHLAPRQRVAHPAVQRVGPILGEAEDVRGGLDAWQLAAQPRDAGAGEHDRQPARHSPIESALEQVEGQRPRRDEEDPDPDRPVREPVGDLVAGAEASVRRQLDPAGVAEGAFVGWRKQRPGQAV